MSDGGGYTDVMFLNATNVSGTWSQYKMDVGNRRCGQWQMWWHARRIMQGTENKLKLRL